MLSLFRKAPTAALPPRPSLPRSSPWAEAERLAMSLRLRGYAPAEVEEIANLLGRHAHNAARGQA